MKYEIINIGKSIIKNINNTKRLYLSMIIGVLFFLWLLVTEHLPFIYDSVHYWNLAEEFTKSGEFNLLNFEDTIRGCILPLIYWFIRYLAKAIEFNEIVVFYIFQTLNFVIICSYIYPNLSKKFNIKVNNIQVILFSCLIFYFWRGYFKYPISDIIAMTFMLIALIFAEKAISINNKLSIKDLQKVLFSGIFTGMAINIRPSYQIILFVWLIIYVYILLRKKEKICNKISLIAICTLGFCVVAIPQTYINYNKYNIISPLVQTQLYYNGESLIEKQIGWGLEIPRYETYAGTDQVAQVYFKDYHGKQLVETLDTDNLIISWVMNVFRYPIDFICIYAKHLFNAMDIAYSTPYIYNLNHNRVLFSFLNYSIWFVFINQIMKYIELIYVKKQKKMEPYNKVIVLSIILSTLIGIVGAVEVRFIMITYIVAYTTISNIIWDKQLFRERKIIFSYRNIWIYMMFILFCFMMSTSTFSTIIDHPIPLIGK